MVAAECDLVIEQGATNIIVVAYKDSAGAAVPLTGYSARKKIRPTIDSSVVYVSALSTGVSPKIVITEATGIITLTLPATDTDDYAWISGVYDLEIEAPTTAVVTRILQGSVIISREVTRT
jgi:hypothetical protein